MWEQVQTHNTLVTNSTRMNSEFEGTTQGRGRAGSQYDYIAVAADDDQKKILLKADNGMHDKDEARSKHYDGIRKKIMKVLLASPTRKDGSKQAVDGFYKFKEKIQRQNDDRGLVDDIAAFKYGIDHSLKRAISPDQMWGAVQRRAAWARQPMRMSFLVAVQITLCVIVVISTDVKMNRGTVVMAVLYVLGKSASNPLQHVQDVVVDIFGKGVVNKCSSDKNVQILLWLLLSPVIVLVAGFAAVADIFVGEVLDCSYAGISDNIVNVIVSMTAISAGLRAGNAIGAIQTFAGFDFISGLDEMVIGSLDIDYDEYMAHEMSFYGFEFKLPKKKGTYEDTDDEVMVTEEQVKETNKWNGIKIYFVKILLYVTVPLVVVGFLYITAVDTCFQFCAKDDNIN